MKEDEWTAAIFASLGAESANYTKVASKQLVGMLIIVLVHRDHQAAVSEVSAEYVGCGILGMMGNKGGVGIRMKFYDSYLTFINSHLAAEATQVERRNLDYSEICRRLQFKIPYANMNDYYIDNPWVATVNDAGFTFDNSPISATQPSLEARCTLFDCE